MTTRTPARRRDAEANRAAILAAATELLARDPGASLDAIATAAGLSRRALYGHFADRGALTAAVIAQGAERFNEIARAQRADAEAAAEPLLALAALAAELWEAAVHVHALAALALDEQHLAASAAALAPVRARLLEICRAGRADGAIRADVPARVTARLIEEVVRGAVMRIDPAEATRHALAPRAALSAAGLGWREAEALLARLPRRASARPAPGGPGGSGAADAADTAGGLDAVGGLDGAGGVDAVGGPGGSAAVDAPAATDAPGAPSAPGAPAADEGARR
ncbi:TetR family transcriptional regulator [Leucobacter allii]|uniref:TetR family transcriptional regulator n=1 Tax=Leucobacter allii TaxID=2932247 RepID=A0ABY4FJA6_9MICO|nr:TetR family transcriptional regulator [Leucobacter allii]UOQ56768.1 TetR family transcriptional regulator [Leucobacter allii]